MVRAARAAPDGGRSRRVTSLPETKEWMCVGELSVKIPERGYKQEGGRGAWQTGQSAVGGGFPLRGDTGRRAGRKGM